MTEFCCLRLGKHGMEGAIGFVCILMEEQESL